MGLLGRKYQLLSNRFFKTVDKYNAKCNAPIFRAWRTFSCINMYRFGGTLYRHLQRGRLLHAKYCYTNFMFMGPCIVIYFYSKTNQMHNFSSLLNITLHVSVFPSIIRSPILYIQRQGIRHTG